MRLLEAILDANHRALAGDARAGLRVADFADALPLVALTCIDPRLNALMPEVLGIPEDQFVWLRNAGNIITSPTSSTMRSLALACAIKGGREIAIIGHSDCKVRQTSALELTERFKALGVDRPRLPENLQEFFGLFASERQNVQRAVELARQSPLLGPRIPVHGLLVELETGKLEWVVNGYERAVEATPAAQPVAPQAPRAPVGGPTLPFNLGELKFPEFKIGDVAVGTTLAATVKLPTPGEGVASPAGRAEAKPVEITLDLEALFKVMGDDRKTYGPVPGREVLKWLAEGRIDLNSLAQRVGYSDWRPLAAHALAAGVSKMAHPPPLGPSAKPAPQPKRRWF